eukprot:PhF_6_TR26489/c0_g1_i1/m.38324
MGRKKAEPKEKRNRNSDDEEEEARKVSTKTRKELSGKITTQASTTESQGSVHAQRSVKSIERNALLRAKFTKTVCGPECGPDSRIKKQNVVHSADGAKAHYKCNACSFVSHTIDCNVYYTHQNVHKVPETAVAVPLARNTQKVLVDSNTFNNKIIPILINRTSMSSTEALKLFREYEHWRPSDYTGHMSRRTEALNKKVHTLGQQIWTLIKNCIDENPFFGLAIDAGIDTVLKQHVLISVLYAGSSCFVLPPLYHPNMKAFNGETTAYLLMDMLETYLGNERLSKFVYMMVDGCTVNHVARSYVEGELADVFQRLQAVGEDDLSNITLGVCAKNPSVSLLSCVGHLLNNVTKHFCEKLKETPLFELKKRFAQAFYSGNRANAKKGKYKGVALAELLKNHDPEIKKAMHVLERARQELTSALLLNADQSDIAEAINAMKALKRHALAEIEHHLPLLEDLQTPVEDKKQLLIEVIPSILTSVQRSINEKSVYVPKLGGVTRWATSHFDSIEFLAKELPTVMAFVSNECDTNPYTSPSLMTVGEIINKHKASKLMEDAQAFLLRTQGLRQILKFFSDYQPGSDQSLYVSSSLENLKRSSQQDIVASTSHHLQRLGVKHNMEFWNNLAWFHPYTVRRFLRDNIPPPSVERLSNLFVPKIKSNTPKLFDIAQGEFESYVQNCTNTLVEEGTSSVRKWWETVGKENYPTLSKAALAYINVPSVVTQCHGILSMMGAKYSQRQASLLPQTVGNQIFLRANEAVMVAQFENLSDSSDDDDTSKC